MSQILKINNSYVNEIISSLLPIKEIITDDTITAGGFPLAVYLKVESTKDVFLPLLIKKLNESYRSIEGISYQDIDIWVKNNSSNGLLNSLLETEPISPLQIGDYSIRISKKSNWANTFSISCNLGFIYSKQIQIIKTRYQNPEDLISKFDLNICKVAWCNGELFVSEDVMNDIHNCELSLNPKYDFGKENFATRIYRSLRFIKYAKRYNLEPSKDICEYIFKVFLDSNHEHLKYDLKNDANMIVINNYYKGSDKIYGMYQSLISNETYEWFSKRKNFKKEWSLFLLNHPNISIIQKIIDGEKNKNLFPEIIF